jgi:2-hydroxy-6-oxonona-2,4-dienedioate hydrolase
MTTTSISATRSDARAAAYRDAERRLWEHYGLAPTERMIEVASPAARIRVVEVGSGPPVLFTHGSFGGGPGWAALVAELPDHRCLMIDRPGFGLSSSMVYEARTYGAAAAAVQREVLDALGVERADLVGASIGDVWALRMAQRFPDRIGHVVLLGGGPLVREVRVPPLIAMLASPLGGIMVQATKLRRATKGMIGGSGHGASLRDGRIPELMVDWRTAVNRHTDSMRQERRMIRAIVGRDGWKPGLAFDDGELAELRTPTLMMFGTVDEAGSQATWQRVMDLIPDGRLRVIEGAGHMPWLDEPVTVARELRQFLSS